MATGYIAPQVQTNAKTSQQNSIYTNGKWHALIDDDVFYEMTLPAVGAQGGWGDGTTEGTAKKTSVGFAAKVNEVGYDTGGDVFHAFSRNTGLAGVRFHSTPYTPGTDTYGTTTTTRLDAAGRDYDNSGFDNGKCSFITDQNGNPLLFAIGAAADTGPPGDGLLIGYDPVGDLHAQILSGFDRSTSTNVDAFLFNDGTNDHVGVLFSDGTNFKLAYHTTESTISNYTTGWVIETIGVPSGETVDDHCCARANGGSMFGVVKGDSAEKIYLITTTGGIDTATNSTTFVFTEVDDNATRPVIVINDTTSEMYVFYNDLAGTDSIIAYKKEPLSGFSFTPSAGGVVAIENGTDVFTDPTPPAGNVTSSMGTFNIFARNTTGTDTTWYQRITLPLDISPTGTASSEAFGTAVITTGAVDISPTGIASAEAFGTAVITTGAVDISPTGIASAEAFGTASVVVASAPTSAPVQFGKKFSPGVTKKGTHKRDAILRARIQQEDEEILSIIQIIGKYLL